MLQLIRENAQGIVIWAIVGLIILGLSSFILSSYLGGSVKTYVAKINDTEISDRQFREAYNRRQSELQQQLGENFKRFINEKMLNDSVVNALVNNEILNQLSYEAGFRVSPDQVETELAKIKPFQDESGRFSNEKFKNVVAQYGYTPKGFALEESRRMANQQLLQGISNSAFVLSSEVDEFQKMMRQQRDVGVLRIHKAEILKTISVSEDDAKAYYELHTKDYMTEEQIKVDYLELSLQALADAQTIDAEEIKQYYENNKSRYSVSNEREASHILIKIDADNRTDDNAALAKLTVIQSRLNAGESFSELAKEYSEDKFSAKKGGKFGRVTEDQKGNKAFTDAVFALVAEGDVSKPVRSKFGYHLIQLDKILPGKTKPFAEVKTVLERELKGQKAERLFYESKSQLENLTYQHQDSLVPAAEEINAGIKTSPFFSRRGGGQIFRNAELLKEAFSEEVLLESLNSQMIKLSDDYFIVVRLNEHRPAKVKPFEQVKLLVENKLKRNNATSQIEKLVQEKLAKLNAGSEVNELIDALQVTWSEFGFIGRQATYDQVKDSKAQATPKTISAEARKASFTISKPTGEQSVYHSMTANNGDGIVVALHSVRDNPQTDDNSVKEALKKQLLQTTGATDSQAVIEFVRSKSDIDINISKDDTL